MIVFPNAKINIGLYVTSKRPDGYHNIETLFYPVKKWNDVLEVITSPSGIDTFSSSGLNINSSPQDNLCMTALRVMRNYAEIPPVKVHLHKAIPYGAGLGGGSADAAFMLKLLNEQYAAGVTDQQLEIMAARIGADCAVFIKNRPIMARGIGNEFSDTHLSLKSFWLQIVVPDIQVSTATAYRLITPKSPDIPLSDQLLKNIEEWNKHVKNDFETPVFANHPAIAQIRQEFYKRGAFYASMSGSGSAVFGLFKNKPNITNWPSSYFIHSEELS